jgi:preprotein translocase subunit YajC
MSGPALIGRHIGERVRVHLARGSIVGTVEDADATAIALELSDGTTATIPIASIVSVRPRAAWARGSA